MQTRFKNDLSPLPVGDTSRRTGATSARLKTQRLALVRRDVLWQPLRDIRPTIDRWLRGFCTSLEAISYLRNLIRKHLIPDSEALDQVDEAIKEFLRKNNFIVIELPKEADVEPMTGLYDLELLANQNVFAEKCLLSHFIALEGDLLKFKTHHRLIYVDPIGLRISKDELVTQETEVAHDNAQGLLLEAYRTELDRYLRQTSLTSRTAANVWFDDRGLLRLEYSASRLRAKSSVHTLNWSGSIICAPNERIVSGAVVVRAMNPDSSDVFHLDASRDVPEGQAIGSAEELVKLIAEIEYSLFTDVVEFCLSWTIAEEHPYAKALYSDSFAHPALIM